MGQNPNFHRFFTEGFPNLSVITTLGFYVVQLSLLMYVNFNCRVNENFVSHCTLLRKTCLYEALKNLNKKDGEMGIC